MTKKFRKIIMWCVSAVFFLKHFNANDMSGMFRSSKATVLDLSRFTTSDVTDMSDIARNSSGTVLDLSRFNLDENNLEGDERHDKLGEEDERIKINRR